MINTQKSLFLYTSNEQPEKEIFTVPFIVASRRGMHPEINLNRQKTSMLNITKLVEIKDLYKSNNILHSWIGRFSIVKMAILSSDSQSECNPYQNSEGLFCRNGKTDPKMFMDL